MKFKSLLAASLSLIMSITLFSCNDDDDVTIVSPNALVTVKTAGDQTCFLQLDDKTTLLPVNMKKSPFGTKEVRALASLSKADGDPMGYDKTVYVNWIDSILTKDIVTDATEEELGNDPVEIVKDWLTVAEDGYLTLRFRTIWGNTGRYHTVNLVKTDNSENPYELEFRHNANGDSQVAVRDGLVAFNLSSLPDTNGETVKLTLKWTAPSGEKSTTFDYCTRKATTSDSQLNNINLNNLLQ